MSARFLVQVVRSEQLPAGFFTGDLYQHIDELESRGETVGEGTLFDYVGCRRRFDELTDALTKEYADPAQRAASDCRVACYIHELMPGLTRRIASMAGVWHQLSLRSGQRYLRWRWCIDGTISQARLLSRTQKPWRNGLARLWWLAELAQGDARCIESICTLEQAIDNVVDQRLSANGSVVRALASALGAQSSNGTRWKQEDVRRCFPIGNAIRRHRVLGLVDPEAVERALRLALKDHP